MPTVAIVDYGSGNLHSAAKALERAAREGGTGHEVRVTADPEAVLGAERIVLPGVGAFADCRRGLDGVDGMVEALEEAVRTRARPFLGICVGQQLMAREGEEFGGAPGLGWMPGRVTRIAPDDPDLKIPHMGWNTLDAARPHALLDGLTLGPEGLHAYFVHSFHMVLDEDDALVATAPYGGPVTAMVGRREYGGDAVSPGEESNVGIAPSRQFPEVVALGRTPAMFALRVVEVPSHEWEGI